MVKKVKILFLADPWNTLDYERDSSLYLADYALKHFNIEIYWALSDGIFFHSHKGFLVQTQGTLKKTPNKKMLKRKKKIFSLNSFHSVHWRVDPPVDFFTLRLWTLLSNLKNQLPHFYNSPSSLLNWNEKFSIYKFSKHVPQSFITNDQSLIKFFSLKEKTLIKPSGQAASRGVEFLSSNLESAASQILKHKTKHGPLPVLQKFLPKITQQGETRVFIIHGSIAGTIHKMPSQNNPIMNFDVEKSTQPTLTINKKLTNKQRSILKKILTEMSKDKIHIASVDFIGDFLLEINVTSVGLIKTHDLYARKPILAKLYWSNLLLKHRLD